VNNPATKLGSLCYITLMSDLDDLKYLLLSFVLSPYHLAKWKFSQITEKRMLSKKTSLGLAGYAQWLQKEAAWCTSLAYEQLNIYGRYPENWREVFSLFDSEMGSNELLAMFGQQQTDNKLVDQLENALNKEHSPETKSKDHKIILFIIIGWLIFIALIILLVDFHLI